MIATQSSRWRTLPLSMIFCLVLAGCGPGSERAADLLLQGDRALAEDRYREAVQSYRRALLAEPNNALAYLALGRAHLSASEVWQAYAAFRVAVELDPGLDQARLEAAALLEAANHHPEALAEVLAIRLPATLQPRAGIVLGKALAGLGRMSEAVEVLESIYDSDGNGEIQALLAGIYHKQGNLEALERVARQWQKLDPTAPSPPMLLAQIALQRGNPNRAREELQAILEAHPGEPAFALLRARLLEEMNLPDEAQAAFADLSRTPETILAIADHALRKGHREEAVGLLKDYLRENPDDVECVIALARVHQAAGERVAGLELLLKTLERTRSRADRDRLLLAKALLRLDAGEWDEAEAICTELLQRNPDHLDARQLLGKTLLTASRPVEAEEHLNRAAQARPDDTTLQVLLARSQVAARHESAAIETLRRALRVNPNHLSGRLELVQLALAQSDRSLAQRVLDQGLEVNPRQPTLLRLSGQLKSAQSLFVQAEADFRRLTELDPSAPDGYLELGRLMLRQTRTDDAVFWFKEALGRGDGWQSAMPHLLALHLSRKDLKSALALAEGELAKRPESPLAHFFLGQARMEAGDEGKAMGSLSRAAVLAPHWPEPYRAISDYYVKQGKLDKAISTLETLYQKNPTPAATMNLASLMEKKGRKERADHLYEELLQRSGRSPLVMSEIALLYAELRTDRKDLVRAAELAADALEQQPHHPGLLDAAGWVAFKQGDLDRAWEYLQQALSRQPDLEQAMLHSALVAQARGDKAMAVAYLERLIQQTSNGATLEKARRLKEKWQS